MPASIYHVRKVSLGFKRKYRILADDGTGRPGAPFSYAEKKLKVDDELVIYRDEQRTEELVRIRESSKSWLAALTGYEAFDREGCLLGSFGVVVTKSVDRSTWELDQPGLGQLVGTERNPTAARVRRLLALGGAVGEIAGALVRIHFDFGRDGETSFSIEKPKVFDDWYRLVVHDDALDQRLLFALAVTMEARLH